MDIRLDYDIHEVRPYINWLYFYFAWGLSGKPESEKQELRKDAEAMLDAWEGRHKTHSIVRILPANSDGDDILVDSVRLPTLRQQHTVDGAPFLCLADFIRPVGQGVADRIGLFCSTVDRSMEEHSDSDPYKRMLSQTLCDRLAEATTELMHLQVRRTYWGYASNEDLPIEDLLVGKYQGIRPAIGYPSLPDTSVNFLLDSLLHMARIGISLTETGMMRPHASVSGLMIAHPMARYFELGPIGEDQLRDYARRRGLPEKTVRRFLQRALDRR